jgi:hypothetical protein
MTGAGLIYTATAIVASGVLFWAGLEKIRDRAPLTATLGGLGVPERLADVSARLVPVAELATVALVVADMSRLASGVMFALLGGGFAIAALWSVVSGRQVACACFGSAGHDLGWTQLAALPLWLFAAWAAGHLPNFSGQERVEAFACGATVLTAAMGVAALRLGLTVRAERHARAEG